ncbi:hypothetical protein [Mesorhizobium caraganae]|uniref:hypothetical protein n=1 Tax=Mesorhizobium caraganae TaxID=483206 RepID=UPI003339E1EC
MIDAVTGDDQAPFERFMMDAGRRGLGYSDAVRELDIRTIFAGFGARPATPSPSASRTGSRSWMPMSTDALPTTHMPASLWR